MNVLFKISVSWPRDKRISSVANNLPSVTMEINFFLVARMQHLDGADLFSTHFLPSSGPQALFGAFALQD